ncbi:chemotaxis protein CheB, partial [Methanocalculus sp.]|uniref:chemotaxis protein CheB n=1 Tax=Methanocalculus sp. TaxID=2004547 RepID=UPI00271D8378
MGIGASAGGLAAFEAFFSGMPADSDPGMAFVLVQHLAPDHKSILTDLIGRYTRMEAFEVEDGMVVRKNCAYIIPPNRDMAFINGTLQLMEPSAPRGKRLPIDFFFRSLATDQRDHAIAIVLSGTGSDGTLGVRAVKGEGGMVMAQTPETTEYDGMPRNAIATGLVDFVLPPAEMPSKLIDYATSAFSKPISGAESAPVPAVENALKKIFILLRTQVGHDFSNYKPSTINRRIERRMAIHQIEKIDEYLKYLQQTPVEMEALFRDFLIGVTSFFRDPEAFKVLEERIIPDIFSGKNADATIRVWVAGCSTGEEAYSIAILIQEFIEEQKKVCNVQVFATDIDSNAIATARVGLYPDSIATDISPKRLAHFFNAEPDGSAYRINKKIRDMMIFSEQDLIRDPPFSKLDLISCRNLLIYMGEELQKKLIPLFHYALLPGGSLFLGSSETVGDFGDLFEVLDRKTKLYRRKKGLQGMQRITLGRLMPSTTAVDTPSIRSPQKTVTPQKLPLRELTERALLQQITPSAALIKANGDILYLHGRTGKYLEPVQGEAGVNNILKMAREGLQRDLTTALYKAVRTEEIVHHSGLRVRTNGDFVTVNLTIRPVTEETGITDPNRDAVVSEEHLYLAIMDEVRPDAAQPAPFIINDPDKETDSRIISLKQEMQAKEEYLQTTREELETSNEELKTSNEEMQSINEEFQSTNEELETSKEELQSVNEELATVNAELQVKVADLMQTSNDMNNLIA